MDTREKILTREEALGMARSQDDRIDVVSGAFDVLTPEMTADLSRVAGSAKLFALVVEPDAPLMAMRARCELAAALRVIDYVVPIEGDAAEFVALLQPGQWYRHEGRHAESTKRLIQHVIHRHE